MRRWTPLLALLVACASGSEATRSSTSPASASTPGGPRLYERVNVRFMFVDMDVLQAHLTDQVCAASGGPCTYAGRAMKPLHAPMHVRGAEFDAMGEDLIAALKTNAVPERETKELLAIIGSTRADIVEPEAK